MQLQFVIFYVIYHAHLLLVEKLPNTEYVGEVFASDLVKVAFLNAQLLLILLLQHLTVEIEEPLDLWRVGQRETVDVLEEALEGREQVLVHLEPLGWEVLFNEYTGHKCQLAKSVVT